uniref:Uncharacterized protein n=1 Tax=Anopheles albimanus TaxID=7167 RepID=A0A182FPR0_ANOAL
MINLYIVMQDFLSARQAWQSSSLNSNIPEVSDATLVRFVPVDRKLFVEILCISSWDVGNRILYESLAKFGLRDLLDVRSCSG